MSGDGIHNARNDMLALGINATALPPIEPLALWSGHGKILRLFLGLQTQWRRTALGAPGGLDYAAIEPTAKLMGIKVTAQGFADLRLMEAEALTYWHSKEEHHAGE